MIESANTTTGTARRIERVSKWMTWVITIGGATMVVAYLSVWLVPGWLEEIAARNLLGATAAISAGSALRLLAATVAALPFMLVLYGLWQIRELFRPGSLSGATSPSMVRNGCCVSGAALPARRAPWASSRAPSSACSSP